MLYYFFFEIPEIELSLLDSLFKGFSVEKLDTIFVVLLHLFLGIIHLAIAIALVYGIYKLLQFIWINGLKGTYIYRQLDPILKGIDWKLFLLVAIGCDLIIEYWQEFSPMVRNHRFVKDISSFFLGEGNATAEFRSIIRLLNFYVISIVFYMLLPILFLFIRQLKTGDKYYIKYTFSAGKWKVGLILTGACWLFMLIVLLIAFGFVEDLRNTYPIIGIDIVKSTALYIIYQTITLFYFLSFEYFFRGVFYFEFERKVGDYAILIMILPYIIHKFGKPTLEILSAIIAGIALAIMSRWTRTFIYGALLHFLVALSADIVSVLYKEGVLSPFN